jgi:hypothetical protein
MVCGPSLVKQRLMAFVNAHGDTSVPVKKMLFAYRD